MLIYSLTLRKKLRKRKMPTCAAKDCQNRTGQEGPKKTFHMFPKSRDIRERWVMVIGRGKWVPGPRAVLCSDHFQEQCFDRTGQTTRLRAGAVPTKSKWVNRRRKGRGGVVKLEPFFLPHVKQEPRDPPSYTHGTSYSPHKKRGPGRPRKRLPSESPEEDDPDDPSVLVPNPALAPAPDDALFMDHYYCRNHQETQAMIQQKEKKAEYLKMKLHYLEGTTKVKQEPPDWTQFRRATLMEEAEEVRRQLRLSGRGDVPQRRKAERNEMMNGKSGIVVRKVNTGGTEVIAKKSERLAEEPHVITGKMQRTPTKIQLITGNPDRVIEKIKVVTMKPNRVTENIKVVATNPDRIPEKIQVITGKPDRIVEKIQVITGKPDRVTETIKVLTVKAETLTENRRLITEKPEPVIAEEPLDIYASDNKLKRKEQEVNDLLKKIKTLQQRKRREKRRNKARIFRYVVMVEPTKKKRGRPRRGESDGEEGEADDDDDDEDDEDDADAEEEEPVPITLDPTSSIQDSILSHTASLMMKPQRTSVLGQEKDKEIRELRRQMRLVQERERDQAGEIQHLHEVIRFLKSNTEETCGKEEIVVGEARDDWEILEGEQCDQWEAGRKDNTANDSSQGDHNSTLLSPRHCRLCHVNLHQRCHKQPHSWSPLTHILDAPSTIPHSSDTLLPLTHPTVRRKAKPSLQSSDLPLCSDCRLVMGRRKASQISPLASLKSSMLNCLI